MNFLHSAHYYLWICLLLSLFPIRIKFQESRGFVFLIQCLGLTHSRCSIFAEGDREVKPHGTALAQKPLPRSGSQMLSHLGQLSAHTLTQPEFP